MIRFLLAALALGAGIVGVRAETGFTLHRGTVESHEADVLTIRPAGGGPVTAQMNPKTRMFIATRSQLRDIKPESYVSVVAVPGPDGTPRPTKVALYSPSERGFEAGSQSWDGGRTTLTAGWIGGLSTDVPRYIELRYAGGAKSFTLPPDTPITQIAPGEKALLVPGADVVAFLRTDAAGVVNADLVVVGRQGAVPSL